MTLACVGYLLIRASDTAVFHASKHLPKRCGVLPFPDFLQRAFPSAGDPIDFDLPCQNRRTEVGAVSYK